MAEEKDELELNKEITEEELNDFLGLSLEDDLELDRQVQVPELDLKVEDLEKIEGEEGSKDPELDFDTGDIDIDNLLIAGEDTKKREVKSLEFPHIEILLDTTRNRNILPFLMNSYKDEDRKGNEYPLFISLKGTGQEGKGKVGKMSLKDVMELSQFDFQLCMERDKEPIALDTDFFSNLILNDKVF